MSSVLSHQGGRFLETIEHIIIGAGVVGLATAVKLAERGEEVVVVEAEDQAGTATSTRNSGVIHAGLYYQPDSLKARLCVAGKQQLYSFCEEYGVPFRRTGKLVVAVNDGEVTTLERIMETAHNNGVHDLTWMKAEAIREREPEIACVAGFWSPSTGIVDTAAYVQALEARLEALGGAVAYRCALQEIVPESDGFRIAAGGDSFFAKNIVNAAGLGAVDVAHRIYGYPEALIPRLRLAKGNYFALSGVSPFSTLVYPVPIPGGLGVHVTLDLAGAARFGPDVEMVETVDYRQDVSREASFRTAIARYYPGVADRKLQPDYTGIRPQVGPLGQFNDYMVQGREIHGMAGLVNLMGIESPGLTSSLALADYIVSLLE